MDGIYLANNIQFLRKKRGYNQEELARALYIERSTISNYENGRSTPDLEIILKMIKFFGVTSDELLFTDLSLTYDAEIGPKLSEKASTKGELDVLRRDTTELSKEVKELKRLVAEYHREVFETKKTGKDNAQWIRNFEKNIARVTESKRRTNK